MITAVDTTVLLDILGGDATFGRQSLRAVRRCLAEGRLVACDVVWAEVAGYYPTTASADDAMSRLGVEYDQLSRSAALAAGMAWRRYRERGAARSRMVADFLIAAHALAHADRMLTRDRGFYRAYFEGLSIVDPTAD